MDSEIEGLDVENASVEGGEIAFTFRNSSQRRFYDVVKLYSEGVYEGFEYVEIPPGEEKEVVFDVDRSEIMEDERVILTTNSREEGVIAESSLGEFLAEGEPEGEIQEKEVEEPSEDVREDEGAEIGEFGSGMEGEPGEVEDTGREVELEELEEGDAAGDSGEDVGSDREELGLEELDIGGEAEEVQGPEEQRSGTGDVPEMGSVRETESSWSSVSSALSSFFGRGSDEAEPSKESGSGVDVEGGVDTPGFEDGVKDREMEPGQVGAVEESQEEALPSELVDRVSTGVINLDGKMQGGLVKDTMNLVTGKTGTGKTAFSACFLKQGIEDGEKGVYVTTEERKEDIHEDIEAMFGWDFREYEEEGEVEVMSIKPVFPSKEIDNLNRLVRSYITDLLNQVKTAIEEIDADRVVIDSVSIIEMFIRDEYMARVALSKLLNSLREEEVTAVLTGGIPETSEGLSGGGIIEYLVDAVILLEFVPVAEEHTRTLTIRKMRRTDHEVDIFPLEITPHGMKIEEVEGSAI